QIKLRGYRIELGEIENTLARHGDIHSAAVAVQHATTGPQLVAYIVAANGVPPSDTEVSRFLRDSLPPYMVPSRFVAVDHLPLTNNGKIDRRALSDLDSQAIIAASAVTKDDSTAEDAEMRREKTPRTYAEREMLRVWREVLQNPALNLTDDFFELGGH